MPTWIISGVSGSGKTSLAQALAERMHAVFLDADEFHPQANINKMRAGQALDECDRELWLRGIEGALRPLRGKAVVLAFPGLKAAHRERVRQATDTAYFAYLKVDLATTQQRLRKRGGYFPPELAPSQFDILEPDEGAWVLDGSQPLDQVLAQALAWAMPGACAVLGLGRMGLGLALRLKGVGFEVSGWDEDPAARARAAAQGVAEPKSLADLLARLPEPRRLMLSLPAGEATQAALKALLPGLKSGDLLINCANERWQVSQAMQGLLAEDGVAYVDAGVSGGVLGAAQGYCVMAGGTPPAFDRAKPLLHAVAAQGALLHVGAPGMGHLVKTVHNGVEYGLMQAYAEGFELLQAQGPAKLDLAAIAKLWGRGAVVRSWLLELAAAELAQDPELKRYEGRVGENSTGRWAAELAEAQGVPVPALKAALEGRERSRQSPSFGSKLLSGLRARFGGHGEA